MSRKSRKFQLSARSKSAVRRSRRPSLWESIQNANNRAQQRANQRIWRRKGLTSVQAAIADSHERNYRLATSQLIIRTLLALILIIPSAVSTLALFTIAEHTGNANFWIDLLQNQAFIFFFTGCFLMCGWFYSKLFSNFFLYLYVLGHELTHVIFIYICGGKVSGFQVNLDGGYVMTNKSNILIALSPYFVPFWSITILCISALLKMFWVIPYHDYALYLAIGGSWTFHLAWTIWMIPRDQPDLKENGTFFSIILIYLANVLLLAVMLCFVPGGLDFQTYVNHWINLFNFGLNFVETKSQQIILNLLQAKY